MERLEHWRTISGGASKTTPGRLPKCPGWQKGPQLEVRCEVTGLDTPG